METLHSAQAVAVIDPDHGAGVVSLTWADRAILSTAAGRVPDSPFAQGLNILAPFSNRISGGFPWDGVRHPVPANLPGEPHAIHGDAFQKAWTIVARTPDRIDLTLTGATGPFRYGAALTYRLAPDGLSIDLVLTNQADRTLPYGGGFHPWFPRDADTRLSFNATGCWPETSDHLPATRTPQALPEALRFDQPSPLPAGWINLGFSGWDGIARVEQADHEITLTAPGLETLLVYSPDASAPYLCVEPVSHPVDAHNLPGQPGLCPLAPGAEMHLTLQMRWRTRSPSDRQEPEMTR